MKKKIPFRFGTYSSVDPPMNFQRRPFHMRTGMPGTAMRNCMAQNPSYVHEQYEQYLHEMNEQQYSEYNHLFSQGHQIF